LVLTACRGVQALGTPPPPSADVKFLRAAIAAEEQMVARYAAALHTLKITVGSHATYPQTVRLTGLTNVARQHTEHLDKLKSRLVQNTPLPHGATPAPLPTSIADLFAALEHAEQAASDRLIDQLDGLPPSFAQLVASIAASEATHVPYLRTIKAGRP
jgi:hypothetical protein